MAKFPYARLIALGGLVVAMGCAGNRPEGDDAAVVRRDTTARDTMAGVPRAEPGVQGRERDTTGMMDTTGLRDTLRDTLGYSGIERDTTRRDTSGYREMREQARDTSTIGRDKSMMGRDSIRVPVDTTQPR